MSNKKSTIVQNVFILLISISLAALAIQYLTQDATTTPTVVSMTELRTDMDKPITEGPWKLQIAGDGRTVTYRMPGGIEKSVVYMGDLSPIVAELTRRGIDVYAEAPPEPSSGPGIGLMLIMSIIPVLILIGAMFWIAKRQSKGGGGIGDFGKNKAKKIDPVDIKISFADIALSPEDLLEIHELADYLKRPEDFQRVNAKPPKGILLCGPPGTGKTLVAKAIAKEAGVPFFSASGSEFDEMLVGAGASRVRSLFEDAQKEGTAIIFIDEIDAVGQNRNNSLSSGSDQTLNQILTAMDGFEDNNIIVMGATNRADTLDPALLRPGRFDRIVTLGLPDKTAREQILKIHLKKVVQMVEETVVEMLAKGTPGFSGADLAKVVNEGAIFAAREKRDSVTKEDLERAKDKVMMGAESPRKMNHQEVVNTAYHEAGHAIVGYMSPEHDDVYKVSIIPRDRALGVTMFLPEDEKYSLSCQGIHSQIATLLAGRAAEEIIGGKDKITTGASNDLQRATHLCRQMITQWGLSELGLAQHSFAKKTCSDETALRIDQEVDKILKENYNKAIKMLKDNKGKLDDMAGLLIEKETIDKDDIDEIMNAIAEVN